jgi:tripeptide aminopeptidase
MSLPLNDKAALQLVMQMLAIPGASGDERAIADFIIQTLKAAGLKPDAIREDRVFKKSPFGGNCGNLIVKLPGTFRAPRRLLMAHIDTVPLCVGARPVRDGDVIRPQDSHTALGGDDRAGAAVVLNTLLTILKHDLPHPPVTFYWPVQEEVGLIGARYVSLRNLGQPKLCFNWDGGAAEALCIGATGAYNLSITVHGIASHAGVHPENGVSAIGIASLAIADIIENGWHGLIVKGSKRGTCNLGIIAGGDATNVVTDRCEIRGEVRSHDDAFRNRIVKEIETAFRRAAKTLKNAAGKRGSIDFQWDLKYPAFLLDRNEATIKAAEKAVESAGLTPSLGVGNGGVDANFLSDRGLPTVTLGCGETNVHTVDEQLIIENYLNACRIALDLACRQPD